MTKMADRQTDNPLISAPAFARLARERLPAAETGIMGGGRSDYDLNPEYLAGLPLASSGTDRRAAVLVPIVARDRLTVLLTRRSDSLKHHAGQIAFPGGRIDLSDTSATAAALREASEEIGVDRTHVTPLGFLDTYTTGTGFTISPLVGLIEPGFTTVLQREEVAEAFEVPLAFLMDPANHEMHTRPWQGIDRRYYAMTWGHYYIWGATAGMLMNLRERLFAP